MVRPIAHATGVDPDSACVASFERALCANPDADLRAFLPPKPDPDYVPTLIELIRVDIERRWARGVPRPVSSYVAEHPELLVNDAVAALAFEDFRGRVCAQASQTPAAVDAEPGGRLHSTMRQPVRPLGCSEQPTSDRPTSPASNKGGVQSLDDGIAARPQVGDTVFGFELKEELGRGAFGRVYLACQADLGNRPVALKVGAGLFAESQTLAQLQHTNIVPIYSLHQSRQFQAVCMPFFGRMTLAHVLAAIRGQAVFPSSGHALVSTLHAHGTGTTPEAAPPSTTGSALPASVAQTPVPPADASARALLGRLSYADAVVWLGAQLAAGLAHAHERGIVHRDLKPANVLLTDDGVPMILDFNLADDTKLRRQIGAAGFGGTLPYMSPEQLEAFDDPSRVVDGRSDVYALGVLLFELLTGSRPFADKRRRPLRDAVRAMREVRLAGAPSPRTANRAVPHGVDSIVRKCLDPDPAKRYSSARDLHDDLERHLSHQPLRQVRVRSWRERAHKWAARHPRLSSSSSVAAVSLVLVTILGVSALYARERNRRYHATETFRDHAAEFRSLQTFLDDRNRSRPALDEGLARCRMVLDRYGVPDAADESEWQRGRVVRYLDEPERQVLCEDVGEVFYLMAQVAYQQAATTDDPGEQIAYATRASEWNLRAEKSAGGRIPRALLEQRADLARLGGQTDEEQRNRSLASATTPAAARDHYLMGSWSAHLGRYREALPSLRNATQTDPEHFSAWFVRGTCHLALEQNEMAALCFGSCLALNKRFAPAWLNRGLAYNRMRFFDQACDDYDQALLLDPQLAEARLQRAAAKEALGDLNGAVADLTAALASGAAPTRVYFFRASLRERIGDRAGAAADRAAGLKIRPDDELSWVARAENRLDEPKAALADVEEALRLNPACMFALQLKAHILAERLGRAAYAVQVLNRAVELYPDNVPARAGRGVLLARAGKRAEALRDAEEALLRDTKGPNLYQVACIYALTSQQEPADRIKALELLRSGLRTGFGLDLVDADSDLDPIRKDPAFHRIVAEARSLQSTR